MTTAKKINDTVNPRNFWRSLKTASSLTLPILTIAGSFLISPAAHATDALATPYGENVIGGSATFDRPAEGQLNVQQQSDRALIEWRSFDIGTNATTQFYQPSSSSIAVNRVVSEGSDPTQILGALKANGQVMVLDRNGVFFGKDSRVDVGGIIASTGDIDGDAFMAGDTHMQLKNFGDGTVENQGMITVAEGGLAALVAPNVVNSGIITAKMGKVELAAGNTAATVDLYGDNLVEFEVTDSAKQAIVDNSGVIDAEGGIIAMTTSGAKAVVDSAINMSGTASAKTVTVTGGKIVLGGTVTGTGDNAKVKVVADTTTDFKGTIKAGKNADIEVSGHDLSLGGDFVAGEGSTITFDPVTFTIGASEAATIVSAMNVGTGSTVNVDADEQIILNAAINTTAQSNTNTLNFRDTGGAAGLQVDLNSTINLKNTQKLTGDATVVNVANTGLIQNGLDVAKSGATVNVAAGTYNQTGNINISKAVNLRGAQAGVDARLSSGLRTANDTDESIVDFGGGSLLGVKIAADDVTIDGFEIRNNQRDATKENDIISSNTASGAGDVNANGSWDNLVVKNNIIHKVGDEAVQLRDATGAIIEKNYVFDVDGDGLNISSASKDSFIQDNEIYDTHSTNGQIYVYDSTNITVQNNYIHDTSGNDGIKMGIKSGGTDAGKFLGNVLNNRISNVAQDGISIYSSNSTVSGNEISGSHSTNGAINVSTPTSTIPNNITITNNYIHDNSTKGVNVSKGTNIAISNNTFANNSGYDVNVVSGVNAGLINITGNSFGGAGANGVNNSGTGILNASGNWWNTTDAASVLARTAGSVDITPFLMSGTDSDLGTTGFQSDNSNVSVTLLGAQSGAIARIAEGMNFVASGGTVNLGAGTYTEQLNINKGLTLKGAGSALTTIDGTGLNGNGITVAADDVTLDGVTVQDFRNSYVGQDYLASGVMVNSSIANLTMNDIVSYNNAAGFYATENASIDGLDIDDSAFNNNDYGFYTAKNMAVVNSPDTVKNVTVDGTSFNGNRFKGIYVEKLSDATFTNIDVIGSAYDASSVNANVAIEANLKNGAYQNITFDDVTIAGGSPTPTTGGKAGVGISVKARNDGATYSVKPATLTNVVIKNSNIDVSNGDIAVAISHGVSGATVADNTLTGPQGVTTFLGASNITVDGNTINTQGAGGNGTIDGSEASVHGIYLKNAGGTNNITDNILIGGSAGIGVYLGGTSTVDAFTGNSFKGYNQYIAYLNGAGPDISIAGSTGNTFWSDNGTDTDYRLVSDMNDDELFALEDRITHKIDNSSYGLVAFNPGTFYITSSMGLQNAVDAASDGDTIHVYKGTYDEHIDVNKSVILLGYRAGESAIGRTGDESIITPHSPGFHITANDVTVDGFMINNPGGADGYGVWIDGANNAHVVNNIINNPSQYGIYVLNGTNSVLQDNEVNNATVDGIRVIGGNTISILHNALNDSGTSAGVNGTGSGIVLVNTDGVTVDDNIISRAARVGVYSGNSSNITITNNDMDTIGSGTNTSVGDSHGQWAGVHAEGTNNLTVSGNTISGTTGAGVNLGGFINPGLNGAVTGTVIVSGNTVDNTGLDGVYVLGGDGALIDNNTITNASANGIYTAGAYNLTVSNNTIDTTVLNNIEIDNSLVATINNNVVSGTAAHAGIALRNVGSATITENTISNSGYGLYADGATNDTHAHGNSITGITNNLVWNNGAPQIYDASGNYWGTTDEAAINGQMAGSVDFTPYLSSGTDMDGLTKGFQGDTSNLTVTTLGTQSGTSGRVQEGVDSVDTAGTVHLNAGTFTGQVDISKVVTLDGAGQGSTIIASPDVLAANASGHKGVISVHGTDNATISNLTVDGLHKGTANPDFSGIAFDNAGGTVQDVTVTGVTNSTFNGGQSGRAIYANNDDAAARTLNITGSTITDFQKNAIQLVGAGLTGAISGNTIHGQGTTTLNAQNGIVLLSGATGAISGNTIDGLGYTPLNAAAIGILVQDGSAGLSISGNTITGTGDNDGIRVVNTDGASITGNTASGGDYGIEVDDSDGVTVSGNTVDGNDYGIDIYNTTNADVADNIITNNAEIGLWVEDTSTLGAFTGNSFKDNGQHITYTNGSGDDLVIDTASGNQFWNGAAYQAADTMTTAQLFALEDLITHKMDDDSYGLVVLKDGSTYVTQDSGSIQRGIDISDAGDTVYIGEGVFNESLLINKSLTLIGDGTINSTHIDGTGINGNGITVAANDVSLNGMVIENFNVGDFLSGIFVDSAISNLSLNDIISRNNTMAGFRVTTAGSIDGLTISNAHFDDNNIRTIPGNNSFGFGFLAEKDMTPGATDNIQNVTITDTSFNGNGTKGFYTEKLSDATFTNVTIANSATRLDNAYGNIGLDITLKNGVYQNLTFDNISVTGSGATAMGGAKGGAAVSIKARNDGSYAATPATLNTVTVKNSTIESIGDAGLVIGNNVHGVSIKDNTGADHISGPQAITVYGTASDVTIENNDIRTAGVSTGTLDGNLPSIHGISLNGTTGTNTIRNNTITGVNTGTGVKLVNASANVGADTFENTINKYMTGISANGGSNVDISYNTVKNSGDDAINVSGTTGTVNITHNKVRTTAAGAGHDGIYITGTTGAVIDRNNIKDAGWDGITVESANGTQVTRNVINDTHGASGIGVVTSDGTTISNNTIKNSQQYGMYLGANTGTLDVISNSIAGVTDHDGIYLTGNSGTAMVRGNDVKNVAHDAVAVNGGSAGVTVKNNDLGIGGTIGNDGVFINGTAGTIVSGNTINNAGWDGITVSNASGTQVLDNVIDDTLGASGVGIVSSSNSTVKGNTITDAQQYGMYLGANSGTLDVANNTVNGVIDHDGIYVTGHTGTVDVHGNTVDDVSENAIHINGGADVTVRNNFAGFGADHLGGTLDDGFIGNDGIHIAGASGVDVKGNTVGNAMNDGIYINATGGANSVTGNEVDNVGHNGLTLQDSVDTVVRANMIGFFGPGAVADGIYVAGGNNVTIGGTVAQANFVGGSGNNGIAVNGTTGTVSVRNNAVLASIAGSSIAVTNVANIDISKNIVGLSGADGIHVGGAGSTNAQIVENEIRYSTQNAINVDSGATGADITGNFVRYADTGIYTTGDQDQISGNNIARATNSAIDANADADGLAINDNHIARSGSGITATDIVDADIEGNTLKNISGNGILVSGGTSADVILNLLHNIMGAIGIGIVDNTDAQVLANTIDADTGKGSFIGIGLLGAGGSLVDGNTVSVGALAGIGLMDSDNVIITDNDLTDADDSDDAGDFGIGLIDSDGVTMTGNTLANREVGIYADPSDNVEVSSNTFDNNGIGIAFADMTNSRILNNTITNSINTGISLTDSSGITVKQNAVSNSGLYGLLAGSGNGAVTLTQNDFTDNATGLRLESGVFDMTGSANTITGGSIGLQLAPAGPATTLLLVGNTLGKTNFTGQQDFYVRLENNAYFDGVTSFVIDGQNAFFDGFSPAFSPFGSGVLTLAQMNAIEGKLYDLDDLSGRGQIFIGSVPGLDPNDLYPNGLGTFGTPGNGFSVTILGMPNIPGAGTTPSFSVASLAGINPAAGGDDMTPEQLAGIETAAGGEDVSCWAGAANASGPVTYKFGNSMAEALDDQAKCK